MNVICLNASESQVGGMQVPLKSARAEAVTTAAMLNVLGDIDTGIHVSGMKCRNGVRSIDVRIVMLVD